MSRRTTVAVTIGALLVGCAVAAWLVRSAARHGGDLSVAARAGFAAGAIAVARGAFFVWAARLALGPEPKRLPLDPGELVLFERPANHQHGLGGGHGLLALTTRRLLFHARKMSFDREPRAFDLASIEDAGFTLGHLVVRRGAGDELFVVQDPADVALLIRRVATAPEADRAAVAAQWREEE